MNLPLSRKKLVRGTTWRYSSGDLHAAYDYPVDIGTPVFAVRGGVVLDCSDGVANNAPGVDPGSGAPSNWILQGSRYKGKAISILYQHLSPNLNVSKGDEIIPGQLIAHSGNSGHSTGPHLHVATMWKHRDGDDRFVYLNGIPSGEGPPSDGTASNGICIFPPTRVFPRQRRRPSGEFSKGLVVVDELTFGTLDSDSVRRLQYRLNRVPLDGGEELPITGNYLDMTKAEVMRWQIQKDGAEAGTSDADGNMGPRQTRRIFGKRYEVVDHAPAAARRHSARH